MFQFRRFPSHTYAFSMGYHDMTHGGLLHSVTPGSLPAYGSPRHFAVSRDLLRLPMPRHSLCALCSLTLLYACFSNFFELLEIAVFYPNFFEYLTLISSLLFFHCSVFKIPCSNTQCLNVKTHCRTAVLPAACAAPFVLLFDFPLRPARSDCGFYPLVGTSGLEPPTSRLSGVRSNHLSYAPIPIRFIGCPSFLSSPWWR